MGESFNTIDCLEPPFSFIDERLVFVYRRRARSIYVLLVVAGSVRLRIDGQMVGLVEREDVLIVPRRCRQVYEPRSPGEERLHIMRILFNPSTLRDESPAPEAPERPEANPEIDFAAFARQSFKAVRVLKGGVSGAVRDFAHKLREEGEQKRAGYRFRAGAYCRLIVCDIAQRMGNPPGQPSPNAGDASDGPSWVVEHAKQFMFENYARPLSLNEIAWEVKLSGEHLCRRFKEETAITVFAYLRYLRMEAAKGFLASSKLSMGAIAERCGFGSSSAFARAFQKSEGMAPQDFRRSAASRIHFDRTSLQVEGQLS